MRNRGWKNQIAFFLYDRQLGGKKLGQMKKSFQEVSGILQGQQKKKKKN